MSIKEKVIDEYYDNYEFCTVAEKLSDIRMETDRIWEYLLAAIDYIEHKDKLPDWYDTDELLVYCKSCVESNDLVNFLTYSIEDDFNKILFN